MWSLDKLEDPFITLNGAKTREGELGLNPAERDVTMTGQINQMNAEFSAPQIRKQDTSVLTERLHAAVYFGLENVIICLPLLLFALLISYTLSWKLFGRSCFFRWGEWWMKGYGAERHKSHHFVLTGKQK